MARKRPPGAKRKGPTVTVRPFDSDELPEPFRRAMEGETVFFVGAGHEFDAAGFCRDFMESTEFEPVPRPDDYSFFALSDHELDDVGAVAIIAHGLHPNHIEALRDEVSRSLNYGKWQVWVPDDIDSLDA